MISRFHTQPTLNLRWMPLAACLTLGLMAGPAAAQDYPTRPVRVIVPYGPGTAPDVIARLFSEGLQRRLNQSFVVENRAGAGGKIGTEAAATSAADGYNLFLGSKDSQSIMSHLYPSWNIKPAERLTAIASLVRIDNVIIARADFPANNLKGLLEHAKTKELSYGTPGIGTSMHLMGEALNSEPNTKLLHIPYSRNFTEGIPAVVKGDLDLLIAGLPPVYALLKEGRIKALAITGTSRSSFAPDIPTFSESGIQGLESGGWFGLFTPSGTPPAIIEKLNANLAEIIKEPAVLERLKTMSMEPWFASPADFNARIEADSKNASKLIKEHNITVE